MAKLTKNLAPLFDSSISYEPGERFMYGDHMYEVIEPLTGVFDLTKVSEVTLADIFKGVSSNDVKCLAPEYDVNTEYSVENLVLYDGVLYECVETTTGPFDETKWSRKYLSDVGGLNSNLNKVKFGEITLQSTSQKIVLGYKPKYIMISCKTATGSASNATSYAENDDGSVNFFTSSGTTTFPNSAAHTINSVNDTGFVIGAFTNPNITKVYFLAGK